MYAAIGKRARFLGTSMVAKHRMFVWVPSHAVPENLAIVIARDDTTTFGILHSRFHELWSLRMGTWLGKGNDPRYTPSTTFETFPFPESLTPDIPAAGYAADPRARAIARGQARRRRGSSPTSSLSTRRAPMTEEPDGLAVILVDHI
jgi:hypothetical protein